jgi:hypothetical protein
MTEETKQGVDILAGSVTLGAYFAWIPEATAVASLVWVLLRIYETDTVQKLLGKSDK